MKLSLTFAICIHIAVCDDVTIFGNETKGVLKQELIRRCAIIVSEDLPYDFKLEYKQKLVIDVKLGLFRLVEVNDLEKT